jgi:hypothetical protein
MVEVNNNTHLGLSYFCQAGNSTDVYPATYVPSSSCTTNDTPYRVNTVDVYFSDDIYDLYAAPPAGCQADAYDPAYEDCHWVVDAVEP